MSDRCRPPPGIQDDRVIAYGVAAEKVFAGLRGLIGQLSGILILVQAGLRRDVAEMPEIAIARERWQEAAANLGRLDPPEGQAANRAGLQQAAAHIDAALGNIGRIRSAESAESFEAAARHLAAAYRLLQGVCDHRIGLTMVDMRDACCSCGKNFAPRPGASRFERVGA